MKVLKISLLAMTLGLMSFSINPVQKNDFVRTIGTSQLSWKSETVDVGQIPQGTPKVIEFEFVNNSGKDVVIINVKPACGCTAADYSKDTIAPGKSGFVKATYNAAAAGAFTKTVTVSTNIEDAPKILTFRGTVVASSPVANPVKS